MTGVRTTLYGINSAQQKIKFGLVSRASRDDITKLRIAVAAFYFIDQIKHKQLTLAYLLQ